MNGQEKATPVSRELRDEYLRDDATLVHGTIEGRLYFTNEGRLYAAPPFTEAEMLAMVGPTLNETLAKIEKLELEAHKNRLKKAIRPAVAFILCGLLFSGVCASLIGVLWLARLLGAFLR